MAANELTDGVIVLTPLSMADADEWLAGEDEEQIRWFEFPGPAQLTDVRRFISETIESWKTLSGHWYWGIRTVGDSPLIGGVDLRDLGNYDVNLSYVIFPSFRNQGFARRASALALQYAREVLSARSVVIKILPGNQYSARLALSLGALHVGDEPSDTEGQFTIYRLNLTQ